MEIGSSSKSSSRSEAMLLSMDDFASFKQVGKGKDCVVYCATCEKLQGASVVLKVYDKAKISAIKHRSVRREARIMRYLTEKRVPHVTAYIGAFQDSKQIYIVMEHCSGGDLLEQLLKEGRAMSEKRVVREVVLPTLTALAYLHAAGIIHRDIKLENLFISNSGHLQLGDLGLALCTLEERAISPVGTLEYMPPEILRLPSTDSVLKGLVKVHDILPVDEKVDVWSFGVTVYELLTGRSPFEGADKSDIKAAILAYKMRPLPSFLTAACQDFVLKAMNPMPEDRPSALVLLNHPWVQLHCTPSDLVAIARLPLQLPKVPMGHKHRSQQQQAATAASSSYSSISSSTTVVASSQEQIKQTAAAATDSSSGLQESVSSKLQSKRSMPSTPGSPQIPAFNPAVHSCGGSSSNNSGNTSCRNISSYGHSQQAAAPAAVGDLPNSGSTGSTSSACSNALSMADSAASLHQASSLVSSSFLPQCVASCDVPHLSKAAVHSHVSMKLAQEPITENREAELAAAAARSGDGSSPQQQQQQQPQLGSPASPISPSGRRSPTGKKLFKWMCLAAGAASPNTSLS